MKLLIKLGGTLLDSPQARGDMARQLSALATQYQVTVVHGGGKQVTRYLEERGITSSFVNGFRVSDDAVIDAVIKNICGTVNKQLVGALVATGAAAVGLSGVDGPLTTAEQWDRNLGWVGRPTSTDGRLLDLLVGAGYLPVVGCIAADQTGQIYNVNADQMAVSCAVGWKADKLLFLTDVPGVKGSDQRVIPELHPAGVRDLIQTGTATGGMQAKLEAATTALENAVGEVVIASGQDQDVCRRVLAGERLGTRLLA